MTKTLEFFFDYVSPTAYLAHFVAPAVAKRTGAALVYKPMFLGGVMEATGNRPPGLVPAKGKWMNADLQRCAKRIDKPLHFNPHFPVNTLGLLRATIGLEEDPAKRDAFIDACFRWCWGRPEPLDPSDPAQIAAMCAAEGFEPSRIAELAGDRANKDKLRANTEEAVARGVFGAPSFFVGDELHFGHDRLDYVEEALAA